MQLVMIEPSGIPHAAWHQRQGLQCAPHARAGEFSRRIPLFFRAFPAIMAV